ncbi:Multidrug resistance-associated protein 1 [Coemansia spiralis]|nr:Multidrug resistance-associated protein 1 [Coemansia spiralis]
MAHLPGVAARIRRAVLFSEERQVARTHKAAPGRVGAPDASNDRLMYNCGERLFLLRAILRMIGWRMAPLYIADCLLQTAAVAEAAAEGLVLQYLDAGRPAVWVAGAALAVVVLRAVGQQSSRIAHLVNLEWHRAGKALELEFLRRPLRENGLRQDASAAGAEQVGALLDGLRSIQHASAQALAVAAAVWPAYRQLGGLLAIPLALWCAKLALNGAAGRLLGQQRETAEDNDDTARDGGVAEIHRSIRTIRYFGWEPLYLAQSAASSTAAHGRAFLASAVWAALDAVDDTIDHAATGLVMLAHSRTAATTTNADVAWTVGLVSRMRQGFLGALAVGQQLRSLVQAYRGVERFLAGDHLPTLPCTPMVPVGSRAAVMLRGCAFRWTAGDAPVLADASLQARAGELVTVCGATGSGKSALLLAVCGQLELAGGSGRVTGRIGYVEQAPWVMGGSSVRDNIVFGREYDSELYARVLYACALDTDVDRWPAGDLTVVGDRGVNMSGGQRARVALARALYMQADVYVLDDPFAAVDARVRMHLMTHVVLGLLADKLCIIATNTAHILPFAHQIVTVSDGRVAVRRRVPRCLGADLSAPGSATSSPGPASSDTDAPAAEAAAEQTWSAGDNARYIARVCGVPLLAATVAVGMLQPAIGYVLDSYILDALQGTGVAMARDGAAAYVWLVVGRQVAAALADTSRQLVASSAQQQRVAEKTRRAFLGGLIHAPLALFDGTTAHQLEAAFRDGVGGAAADVCSLLSSQAAVVARTGLALYRVSRAAPALLLLAPAAAWAERRLRRATDPAADALGRELDHTGTALHVVTDTISTGRQTIRLAGTVDHFVRRYAAATDRRDAAAAAYDRLLALSAAAQQLLAEARDALVLAALLLLRHHTRTFTVGSAELIRFRMLAQTLLASSSVLAGAPAGAAGGLRKVSVLRRFAELRPEAPYTVAAMRPAESWPAEGAVEFRGFSLRYGPDLDWALRDINLAIRPGEKIGIVGRTGAGKSSLARALFRMAPDGAVGAIVVDGQDISEMGVGDLRRRLGTVPQEPHVPMGTVREVLDPLGTHTVEELAATLAKCRAAGLDPGALHLDARIGGRRGLRLSSGQLQILGLCRLLLRRRRIIVLDEATAAVDPATDDAMQDLIRREFAESTILTIAHRLETVVRCDRIVVMDHGRIAEIGAPLDLLAANGLYAQLVRDSALWRLSQ